MAVDAYLKIAGVDGEATTHGFEKWIEIESFSWGADAPSRMASGAGGMSTGRVNISTFNVMKRVDTSTPILFQYCCTGKHFTDAKIILTKAGGKGQDLKYLEYDFKQLFVTAIQMSGSGHSDSVPMDSLSFSFGAVEVSYTPQTATGDPGSPVRTSYDVAKAK